MMMGGGGGRPAGAAPVRVLDCLGKSGAGRKEGAGRVSTVSFVLVLLPMRLSSSCSCTQHMSWSPWECCYPPLSAAAFP